MEGYTSLYQHYLKEFSQEDRSFINNHLSFGDYKDIAVEYGVHDADLVCHRELNMIHREDALETDYVNNVIEEIKGLYEDDRLYGEPTFPDMPSTYEYAEHELQKAVKRGVKEENLEKIADAIEDKGIP